ncbi:hypothetical protein FQN60_015451 [Etheostoma spectabile]|uniref:Uncharacterized protein n=1 Tax=Etheostoma spectabile TaxID=54343 RepID=A0A5J5CQF6_9PERO|nr:hypothetical protein FQN60_015451 [Etheostoma spectabile]
MRRGRFPCTRPGVFFPGSLLLARVREIPLFTHPLSLHFSCPPSLSLSLSPSPSITPLRKEAGSLTKQVPLFDFPTAPQHLHPPSKRRDKEKQGVMKGSAVLKWDVSQDSQAPEASALQAPRGVTSSVALLLIIDHPSTSMAVHMAGSVELQLKRIQANQMAQGRCPSTDLKPRSNRDQNLLMHSGANLVAALGTGSAVTPNPVRVSCPSVSSMIQKGRGHAREHRRCCDVDTSAVNPRRHRVNLLWRAEGLVDVGRKLLHLVVHQQLLRDTDKKLETQTEICAPRGAEAWFHLNKVAGSLTADGVDLTVDDGDDLRQRQTDCRQAGQTETNGVKQSQHGGAELGAESQGGVRKNSARLSRRREKPRLKLAFRTVEKSGLDRMVPTSFSVSPHACREETARSVKDANALPVLCIMHSVCSKCEVITGHVAGSLVAFKVELSSGLGDVLGGLLLLDISDLLLGIFTQKVHSWGVTNK